MRITRRQLLVGGAVAAGTVVLGNRAESDATANTYDVCVIGSGFAGTYLALRAIDSGLKTLLVEAGPHPRVAESPGTKIRASLTATNTGEVDFSVNGTRVIALGGTSNHWGGVVTRIWPDEFRMRSKYKRSVDWPISYGDLDRYYCEAEQLLQVRGFPEVVGAEPPRSCEYPIAVDRPYVNPSVKIEGREVLYFPIARSLRGKGLGPIRLVDLEIPRFEQSEGATLLVGNQVTRLVSATGRSVDYAELRKATGERLEVRARRFVLAAGVIENTRLLLNSASEKAPRGLGNARGLVGRYFNCHPSYETRFLIDPSAKIPSPGQYRTGSLRDLYRKQDLNGSHFQLDIGKTRRIRWRAQPEIEARYENAVVLSPSQRDLFGQPLPEVQLSYSKRDQRTIARLESFLEASRVEFGGSEVQLNTRWRAHPAGTTRMGFSEKDGVVDAHNRVFGVDNLYVSGACTFPTSGTPNPTDTVVAMTLRLADHLIERL